MIVPAVGEDHDPGHPAGWEQRRSFSTHQSVSNVSFTPDGIEQVFGTSDGAVGVWSTETGEIRIWFTGHRNLRGVFSSPDGRVLLSTGGVGDRAVRLWDRESGQHS